MERLKVNDHAPNAGDTSWTQTTLFDLIDRIGRDLKSGEAHRLEGIMLDLGNTGRLRESRRWARIKFVFSV